MCLFVLCVSCAVDCLFFAKNRKDENESKDAKDTKLTTHRRLVLVPKTIYVPVYTSDASNPPDAKINQNLTPVSTVLTSPYALAPPPMAAAAPIFDYAAAFNRYQPGASYAMYSAAYPPQIPLHPHYSMYYGADPQYQYIPMASMGQYPAGGYAPDTSGMYDPMSVAMTENMAVENSTPPTVT